MIESISQFQQAIINSLSEKFSHKVYYIQVHSPLVNHKKGSAILLNLESMTANPDDWNGDGRLAFNCDFCIAAILPEKGIPKGSISLAIANFASEVMDFIILNRWGYESNVNNPGNISGQPAEFKPGKEGYESWAITWTQTVYLGIPESTEDFLPETIMASHAPDIGQDNENSYVQL